MLKRCLMILGMLSATLVAGCSTGVVFGVDTDAALNPEDAITINGTLTVGASASISKSKSAGVTKDIEVGTCTAMLVGGTVLGTAGVAADGSFTIRVDPAITSQDVYGVILLLCYPTSQSYPLSQFVIKGDLAAGDSVDTGVDIETSIAVQGVVNDPENTDEVMAAASKYPLTTLHEMLMIIAEPATETDASAGNQLVHKEVRDFLVYLLGQTEVGPTLTSKDIGALLRYEPEMFEALWPHLEGSPYSDMEAMRGLFNHDMFFRQVLSALVLDPETLERVRADDVVKRAYSKLISLVDGGTALQFSDSVEDRIGNLRGILGELVDAYRESGDVSYIHLSAPAAQTMLSAAWQCSPESLDGNLDAMVIYIMAINDDDEIAPNHPGYTGTYNDWVANMGGAVATAMNIISAQTTDEKREMYKSTASFTMEMCASAPSLCGAGDINEQHMMQRVEAKVEADLAGNGDLFEGKETCFNADSCPSEQTCSFGIWVCMTACSSGSCGSGFPCTIGANCGTNFCKKDAGQSHGSCAHCGKDSDCSSGTCNSESHCAAAVNPVVDQPLVKPECSHLKCKIDAPGNKNYNFCNSNGLCVPCSSDVQCETQAGAVGWTCNEAFECAPPPPLPAPVLSAVWNRTTAPPPNSSVTGCNALINADNLTISGTSPDFAFAALTTFTINWNGLGTVCTAMACTGCQPCQTCSVTPVGTWNVLTGANCDMQAKAGVQGDCDFSYTKQPPPP